MVNCGAPKAPKRGTKILAQSNVDVVTPASTIAKMVQARDKKADKVAATGGDDLDDGLELDPDLLASDDEDDDEGIDPDADIGDEETRPEADEDEVEESGAEVGEKRKRDGEGEADEEERKAEKRRRKKEKLKERKAKVCLPIVHAPGTFVSTKLEADAIM